MTEKCIAEINRQGKSYKPYTNQWNVMQQLIDIVSAQPDSAQIVLNDLAVKEMNLGAIVSRVTGKRLADPRKVMEEICDFYKIPCPKELPPEVWRGAAPAPVLMPSVPSPAPAPVESEGTVSLLDLL